MVKLGIITLTRTPKFFRRLVESFNGVPVDDIFRIVVNNGQSPDLTEYAYRSGWAILNPRTNLSFSEGNNLAAKVAISQGCTHLLLLNDDAIASPKFLDGVIDSAPLADPVVGFRITSDGKVNHDGTKIGRSGWRTGVCDHINRGGELTKPDPAVAVVPSVTFAAVLVSADGWTALGGLNEGYFYGWEDTDFCLRAIAEGGTIKVRRDVDIEHGECGTRIRHSKNDLANAELFLGRWQERIPALFDEYETRHPRVEGLGWDDEREE
jgi:GT2 family glycosyltransferase